MIGTLAWGFLWIFAIIGLFYVGLHAGHWLEERRELKKLRAWFHKFDRGEVEDDG